MSFQSVGKTMLGYGLTMSRISQNIMIHLFYTPCKIFEKILKNIFQSGDRKYFIHSTS